MGTGSRWWLGAALAPYAMALVGAPPAPRPAPQGVDFAKQILPAFKASCFQCHGKDLQMGGLRLDTREGLEKGGVSGKAVIPGDSAKSLLVVRLLGLEGKPRMPMGYAPLPDETIELVKRWIDEGAAWSEAPPPSAHWAYVPPKAPAVPDLGASWVRGPIDAFVLEAMRAEGLAPNPAASRETLIRRVTFDLTGLPPTLAEIDVFLADSSADAYERVVDRLLASPHYGEHMAAQWLDLARYADTNGYEKDDRRSMWPYRDWVIRAFNEDMPYDRFTILQIAGDLVPDAGLEGKIASGFHRNTMTNLEGGVDKEEQRWLTLVDRVGTTGTVWLGTTLACAQCHDHKFDPISDEEFYRFLAYFDNCEEPTLELPSEEAERRKADLRAQIAELEAGPKDEAAGKRLEELKKQLAGVRGPTTLVFVEKEGSPRTFIRIKGTYLAKGPEVEAGVPAVLPPLPPGAPNNRLGLARWLVDAGNPLTPRVEVNRLWERIFGRGIVASSGDFGTRADTPAQPKLLDWMAAEFVRDGWSIKRALRRIVTSATYMQAPDASAERIAADPDNRWLARGPRFRLEAESIRDMALSVAGLLSDRMGGPSVFPDQPAGVWHSPYSSDDWKPSEGDDRWRRGIYTFLKRTAPYPMFLAFDSTSRESCTVRRVRTNTPLQALATLNDTVFMEASRGLADRMASEASADPRAKVAYAFRLATSRRPDAQEIARLAGLYEAQLRRYRQRPEDAKELAGSPERAAWTVVANVILNLDETLTKG